MSEIGKTVFILDTVEGRVHSLENRFIIPECMDVDYWWRDGNGCCDCNRAVFCGNDSEGPNGEGYCWGCSRYLLVDENGRPLEGFNKGYEVEKMMERVNNDAS